MRNKIALLILALLALSSVAKAQTTSLTLQVTDTGGQSWNNGTWSVTLATPPGRASLGPPFYDIGTTTPVPNQTQSGLLSGSGSATMTLTQNSGVAPAGSQWRFTVCPFATSPCYSQFATITATATLTLTPPAVVVQPLPGVIVNAYSDTEISSGAGLGTMYFNVTSSLWRGCNALPCGAHFTNIGTGGGGGSPGGTDGQIQYNLAGAFAGFTPGGDVSFANPNFSVTNLSHVTNASLPNSGLVNSSITITNPGFMSGWGAVVLGGVLAPSWNNQLANTIFGNCTTGSAAPNFCAITAAMVPTLNQNTTGNAATASALANPPTTCGAGVAATGILANGNATGCFSPSGSGTVNNCGTSGLIAYYAATGTIVSCDAVLSESGTVLTYSGTGGVTAPSFQTNGTAAGFWAGGGSATAPTAPTNSAGWAGPASASFTAYLLQLPSVGPTATNDLLTCGLPSSGLSTCSFGPYSFSALSGLLGCGQLPTFTGDVTNSSCAMTVVQVEGAAIPTSAACVGTNGSKQLVACSGIPNAELANSSTTVDQQTCTLGTTCAPPHRCEVGWGGTNTANALQTGDDAVANQSCGNDTNEGGTGISETVVAVGCRSDAASNTTTVQPSFGSTGTGTNIISSALTCGSNGAYAWTTTIANATIAAGNTINPVMGGTLTGTSIHLVIRYHF